MLVSNTLFTFLLFILKLLHFWIHPSRYVNKILLSIPHPCLRSKKSFLVEIWPFYATNIPSWSLNEWKYLFSFYSKLNIAFINYSYQSYKVIAMIGTSIIIKSSSHKKADIRCRTIMECYMPLLFPYFHKFSTRFACRVAAIIQMTKFFRSRRNIEMLNALEPP